LPRGVFLSRLAPHRRPQSQVPRGKRALRLSAQSSYEDAQNCAESLVAELDLGVVPAQNPIDKIERELDIPVLFVDTVDAADGQSISGATCHLEEMGVILINRNENEARRFFDLAHELFHALTWDAMKPDHQESNSIEDRTKGKRIEQLANSFAAALKHSAPVAGRPSATSLRSRRSITASKKR
jgi:hypothetical protein